MAYDEKLADLVREYLVEHCDKEIMEKPLFSGLAFLVDDKMCINISGDQLMCRFDPAKTATYKKHKGFQPMIMRGKELDGYCLVDPDGYRNKKDFEFWMDLCLAYNPFAKSSKKKKPRLLKNRP